ncbi:MAG: hypothetical protein JW941_00565 [Candidatus Coatesbacteria bacterium]|nr:hypothetical protein [Candidatus Coatesbacteria bacterium]
MTIVIKDYAHLSALILAIINGSILFWRLRRDRPNLQVRAVEPKRFQWWFSLPGGEMNGQPTRRYGFLAYVRITNRGLRNVGLDKWGLKIKTKGGVKLKLKPTSIPEPRSRFSDEVEELRYFPVLGERTERFDGNTLIESGMSISGIAYYVADVYGSDGWDPSLGKDRSVEGKFRIQDVLDNETSCKIIFSEISLDRAREIVPGIGKIGL